MFFSSILTELAGFAIELKRSEKSFLSESHSILFIFYTMTHIGIVTLKLRFCIAQVSFDFPCEVVTHQSRRSLPTFLNLAAELEKGALD